MLDQIHSNVYVLNLPHTVEYAEDRMDHTDQQLKKIGCKYERFEAVIGDDLDEEIKPNEYPEHVWNKRALGLVHTTINVLNDAIEKGYESIVIIEDDIEFHDDFNTMIRAYHKDIPKDWEMIMYGSYDYHKPDIITKRVGRIKSSDCLHCYAIHSSIFEYYKSLLDEKKYQIDVVTQRHIQPRGTTYCLLPNKFTWQREGWSFIAGEMINRDYLK